MKKLFPLLFFALIFIGSCVDNDKKKIEESSYQMIEGLAQGTSYHITFSDLKNRDFQLQFDSLIEIIDLSMSTYIDNSRVSLCNNSESNCFLDNHMSKVLWKSYEVFYLTDGEFDPTVKPLIDFWGFGAGKITPHGSIDSSLVDSLLKYVGLEHLKLYNTESGAVIEYMSARDFDQSISYGLLKDGPTQLDFNAIAQGYTVDVICELLESKGVLNYLVEVGGEVRVKGKNGKGNYWKVGVDKPIEDNRGRRPLQAALTLENKSIATSGNYRKFNIKDGIKYSHTISAKTGYPVTQQILSATVIADDCMTADAFATAFMVMGHKKAIKYLQEHKTEIQGYLIYSDDKGDFVSYISRELEDNIDEQLN